MAVNFFPEENGSGGSGGGTGNYIPLTQKGSANGVATLDASSKVPSSQLPDISITNTFVVATETEMLALNAQTGDIAVRTDVNNTFILKTSPASVIGNWVELPTPTNGVFSVDGKTGAVTLANTYQAKNNELTALSALTDTPGFVKKVGDGIYAIDTTTYLSVSNATASYQPLNANLTSISGIIGPYGFLVKTVNGWELNTSGFQQSSPLLTGIANLTGDGYLEKVGNGWVLNAGPFQPLDTNLTGISAIAADGFLTRTGGVWSMDSSKYQVFSNELSGFSALPDEIGLVKKTGDGTYVLDKNTYLTGSSSITITGDVTGTGTNSNIATTLASITTGKTSTKVTFNDKGLILSGTTLSDTDLPPHTHTVTLTGDVTGTGSNSSITTSLPTITSANTATKITYTAKGLVTGGTTLTDADLPPHTHTVNVTGDITGNGLNSSLSLTLPNIATAGTYTKVGVNTKGQVTSGSNLLATDIPNLDWAKITTGKPTTLSGYGITDALTVAGTGLTSTGNTINAIGTAGRIVANADSLDLATVGTPGTYTKITTDAYGRAITGANLSASDIPDLDASKITTGYFLNQINVAGIPTIDRGVQLSSLVNSSPIIRWLLSSSASTEPGGNIGSHFGIVRYADDGTQLSVPFIINRATGNISISTSTASTSTTTGAVVVSGGVGCQGSLNVGGAINGSGGFLLDSKTSLNNSIEIGSTTNASTPFIDFHSGAIATDYDARIIASGGNGTSANGSLSFTCASATFQGTVIGTLQFRAFTNATRPTPSANTLGQCYLNTDTGNLEYIATSTTRKVITAV